VRQGRWRRWPLRQQLGVRRLMAPLPRRQLGVLRVVALRQLAVQGRGCRCRQQHQRQAQRWVAQVHRHRRQQERPPALPRTTQQRVRGRQVRVQERMREQVQAHARGGRVR